MKAYLNFFTLLGLLFIGGAAIAYSLGESFRQKAEITTGTVIDFNISVDSEDGSESYCPRVRYKSESGREYTYDSNFCSSPPAYEVGEQVEIFYNPENPEKGQIKGFWTQYLFVLIFSCIGVPLTGVGIWAGLPSGKKSKS